MQIDLTICTDDCWSAATEQRHIQGNINQRTYYYLFAIIVATSLTQTHTRQHWPVDNKELECHTLMEPVFAPAGPSSSIGSGLPGSWRHMSWILGGCHLAWCCVPSLMCSSPSTTGCSNLYLRWCVPWLQSLLHPSTQQAANNAQVKK